MRIAIIFASAIILTSHAFAQMSPNSPGKFCLRGQSGATQGSQGRAERSLRAEFEIEEQLDRLGHQTLSGNRKVRSG